MPRAEFGSAKHLSNQMKSRGLQRLRWYCQVCEKQCRDENGFKCHTMSESHVRNMQQVAKNAKGFIDEYSSDFKRDFLQLLKTSHGTKGIHINKFYQEYIGNKTHIHLNATRWKSLTEFAKYLGREGICKVEENEKGFHIAWVDRSPEALRRQEAVRQKERQQQGDQKWEEKLIQQQVERAQQAAAAAEAAKAKESRTEEDKSTKLKDGEKMTISFGLSLGSKSDQVQKGSSDDSAEDKKSEDSTTDEGQQPTPPAGGVSQVKPAMSVMKLSLGAGSNGLKPKNGLKRGNVLSGKKTPASVEPTRKITEAERIMREEMEAEQKRKDRGFGGREAKRLKVS